MNKKAIDVAIAQAELARESMPYSIDLIRFRRRPEYIGANLRALSDCHIKLGIESYLVNSDIAAFKQHAYVATALKMEAIRLNDHGQFQIGSEITWALLSDNLTLINAMASFEPPEYLGERNKPLQREYWVHMIQLAIMGDYAELEAKVLNLGKNGRKEDRAVYGQRRDFFSLLMRGDKAGLEELISQDSRVTKEGAIVGEFLSFIAAIEAKICWLKGINVEIESPYLPMDLMPVRTLTHYDELYDFLTPTFVPPKISIWSRLSYWYGQTTKAQ